MSINYFREQPKLPKIPPLVSNNPYYFRYLLEVPEKAYRTWENEKLFCALVYGWNGWTDGGLWVINRLPNKRGNNYEFTDIVVHREMMLDYYRRYKFISPVPALYYRDVKVKTKVTMYKRHFLIYADPERSIAIWRPHMRVIYTTFIHDTFTLWVHPFLNSYTVTIGDDVVAFGRGIDLEDVTKGREALKNVLRMGILQIRSWWEWRVQKKYMEKGNAESLFSWRYNVIG